jgi:ABC-2 type transport system permease protein
MSGPWLAAVSAEWVKVRRSKLPLATFGAFTVAAAIGALFMSVLADPTRAARLGAAGQKAQLSNLTPDWSGLLGFLGQVVAVGGLLVFSFVAAWVFGREFSDGTQRYLLALPVPRGTVVAAKVAVVAVWCAALTAWLLGLGLALGVLLGLPGGDPAVVASGVGRAVGAAALMILAVAPVPLVACLGRGYLAPIGAALGALVVAQVAAALGAGGLVPWSIPAVAVGLAPGTDLGPAGCAVAVLTGVAGTGGTLAWWRRGDAGL